MKTWCAILTILTIANAYWLFELFDYGRKVESQVNKVVDNTDQIISNEGFLLDIERGHFDLTYRNMGLFKGLLPKPECVNVLDEHQWLEAGE